MRADSFVAGLALTFALAPACASSGTASGRGGSGPGGAGTNGGAGGNGVGGTGGASAGTGGAAGTFGISGPTRCDATLPLCESFENGIDGNLWKTTMVGDATVSVDSTHAA